MTKEGPGCPVLQLGNNPLSLYSIREKRSWSLALGRHYSFKSIVRTQGNPWIYQEACELTQLHMRAHWCSLSLSRQIGQARLSGLLQSWMPPQTRCH